MKEMYHKRTKRLVELCPQCCKSVDSSVSRLVRDACGHSKCRICLLQEVTGCLICEAEERRHRTSNNPVETFPDETLDLSIHATQNFNGIQKYVEEPRLQQRKSVIQSLASHIAELSNVNELERPPDPLSPIDTDTCMIIEQTLRKDILFPTNIVKQSTGNFYHLKRILSERFFNEDKSKHICSRDVSNNIEWSVGNAEYHSTNLSVNTNNTLQSNSATNDISENRYEDTTYNPTRVTVISSNNEEETFQNGSQVYLDLTTMKPVTDDNAAANDNESPLNPANVNCNNNHTVDSEFELSRGRRKVTVKTEESEDNINPLKCKICFKIFKSKVKLKRHTKRSHEKKTKFKCSICYKVFKDNYALKCHTRTHTAEKPFSCLICKKTFSESNNLKRHEKQHGNKKVYSCNVCQFKCLAKYELKDHSVIHSNQKPYFCVTCNKQFSFKKNYTRHLQTHKANLSGFVCHFCESIFKRKDNLERHIKNAHTEYKDENVSSRRRRK